jgi:hypothetical protein
VRLVGDFDDWTHGVELSASDVDYDSSMRSFEGTVPLLPVSQPCLCQGLGRQTPRPPWPSHSSGSALVRCDQAMLKTCTFCCAASSQGKYRVKFMVDGEWRLAPEWQVPVGSRAGEFCLTSTWLSQHSRSVALTQANGE